MLVILGYDYGMDKYCRHGHEYTPENSYTHEGVVQCKECRRVNRNKSYRRYNPPIPPEIRWPKHSHCVHGHELTPKTRMPCKGGGSKCRVCHNLRMKVRAQERPEYMYKSRIESQMHLRYGIESIEERDELLASQGDACAICGRTGLTWGKGFKDVWHVDHVHGQEGTHRGILCATCNLALGKLESHMGKVLEYLAKHKRKLSDGNLDSNDTGHN